MFPEYLIEYQNVRTANSKFKGEKSKIKHGVCEVTIKYLFTTNGHYTYALVDIKPRLYLFIQ